MVADQHELDPEPFAELVGDEVVGLIIKTAPTKVRSRIAKALDHYVKALALVGVDEEMGAIRLIAAEEELVVAVFEWLKLNAGAMPQHRDFIGKQKNHGVKLTFHPVLSQFRFALTDMVEHGFTIEGLESLELSAAPACVDGRVAVRVHDGKKNLDLVVNPLDLAITRSDISNEQIIAEFYKDFEKSVRDQLGLTVREFVARRVDFRNKLLYAEDRGFDSMGNSLEELLEATFRDVLRDLLWCIGVLLTNKPTSPDWGLAGQFVSLYRRVLAECKIL